MPLNNPKFFDQPQRRTGIQKNASAVQNEGSGSREGEDDPDLFKSFH